MILFASHKPNTKYDDICSILIVMLTLFACINRPRGRPLWIKRVKKPTIETLVKASSSHPSTGAPPSRSNDDSQPPPGSSSIGADLASLASGKGKSGKGFAGFLAKHSRSFEFVLIGVSCCFRNLSLESSMLTGT